MAVQVVPGGSYDPVTLSQDQRNMLWSNAGHSGEAPVGYGGEGGGGVPDIKLSDIGGSAVDFAKGLNVNEDAAFDDYLKTVQGQESPLDVYGRLEGEAGIPQLRTTQKTLQGQVASLEDTLRRVEGDVSTRTRNSLVTEAQRRRLVTSEQEPLQENLGWLTQSLGRVGESISGATADIGNKVNLTMAGQERQLEPYKMKLQVMAERSARLMTGFTADRQAQLDILTMKLQRQQQLEDREWEAAQKLLAEERAFNREKDLLISKGSSGADTEVVSQGGRRFLINKQTGEVIADYGSSGGGGTASGANPISGGGDWE